MMIWHLETMVKQGSYGFSGGIVKTSEMTMSEEAGGIDPYIWPLATFFWERNLVM